MSKLGIQTILCVMEQAARFKDNPLNTGQFDLALKTFSGRRLVRREITRTLIDAVLKSA